MQTIAPDVHRIALLPRDGLNAYLLGDVLVDAGFGKERRDDHQGARRPNPL